MEIRTLTSEERPLAEAIWSQAFSRGNRERENQDGPWRQEETTYGVWDAAGLQAVVLIHDYHIYLSSEAVTPMGGVGGVACLPASRGKGYARKCLFHALEQMRERGQVTSMLFPFSWEFYRNLGWEWTGIRRCYKLPTRLLKAIPETENVRAATPQDKVAIANIYEQYAKRYRGALQRPAWAWDRLIDDRPKQFNYTYLYEQNGQPEGYFTFRGGKEEETKVHEFVALTPLAYRALLGVLKRHEMQVKNFLWEMAEDDALWFLPYQWDMETKLEPATMSRIVDVPGALQAWKPAGTGHVSIQVKDTFAPWNTGVWRVEWESGTTTVTQTQDTPQISLDIQALTQAYLGTPTPDALRAADRLTVHDEAGFAAFRAFFAGPLFWMNDFF